MGSNIFSVLCVQGGEAGRNISLKLLRTFSEKLRMRTVYIPAGVIFDDIGDYSLTELYYDYSKGRVPKMDEFSMAEIIRPFNCFAETVEITDENYFEFVLFIAKMFEIAVLNIGRISSELIVKFMKSSMTVAVVIDCGQKGYIGCFENFMRNLKLLWKINREEGNEILHNLSKFIFVISNGGEMEKSVINEIAVRETQQQISFMEQIYLVEENLMGSGRLVGKRGRNILNLKNIFIKKAGMANDK